MTISVQKVDFQGIFNQYSLLHSSDIGDITQSLTPSEILPFFKASLNTSPKNLMFSSHGSIQQSRNEISCARRDPTPGECLMLITLILTSCLSSFLRQVGSHHCCLSCDSVLSKGCTKKIYSFMALDSTQFLVIFSTK